MANMDYCKFENTAAALSQCMESIDEMGESEEACEERVKKLSPREIQGLCDIVAMAQVIAGMEDEILDAIEGFTQN